MMQVAVAPISAPAPHVSALARAEQLLDKIERSVAVLAAWHELLARGRRHDA
jgi:hypothetical protein